jgi:hypothetical protein
LLAFLMVWVALIWAMREGTCHLGSVVGWATVARAWRLVYTAGTRVHRDRKFDAQSPSKIPDRAAALASPVRCAGISTARRGGQTLGASALMYQFTQP